MKKHHYTSVAAFLLLATTTTSATITEQYRCQDNSDVCYRQQTTIGTTVVKVRPHGNGLLQESSTVSVVVKNTLTGELAKVHFAFDEAGLSDDARAILTNAAPKIRTSTQKFVIEGHADSRGSEAYNQNLGQQRAEQVARFLTTQGIAPGRLVIRSQGEIKPVGDNQKPDGRARNRRVEVVSG